MAHIDDLTTNQQTFLKRHVIKPIYYKLTLHTDDGDVVLDDDIIEIDAIKSQKRIDLDENMEQFTVGEVSVNLINWQDKYDREKVGGLFQFFRTPTITAVGLNDTTVKIPKMLTPPLGLASVNDLVNKYFRLSDGKVDFKSQITAVTEVDGGSFHQLTFSPAFPYDYSIPRNFYLEINQMIGRSATLEYNFQESGVENLLAGKYIVSKMPDLEVAEASLVLTDAMGLLLNEKVPANTVAVKSYNRAGSSTGTIDGSQLSIVWAKALIGKWSLKIDSLNGSTKNFTVTLPDGSTKTGSSNISWWSDKQNYRDFSSLEIPPFAWLGSFDVGDEVVIETYYQQSNFTDNHLVDGLNTILGSCLGSEFYDSTATNNLVGTLKPGMSYIEPNALIKKEISCLKLAAVFCQHLNLSLFVDATGKVDFTIFKPFNISNYKALNGDTDIIGVEIEHSAPIKAVEVLYNYDWETSKYLGKYRYPVGSQDDVVTLKLPFFTSQSRAAYPAQYYYIMHGNGNGLRKIQITQKFNYGIGVDLGDRFKITSTIPTLSDVPILIYGVNKKKGKSEVEIQAIDTATIWSDVLIYDVDNYDEGDTYA